MKIIFKTFTIIIAMIAATVLTFSINSQAIEYEYWDDIINFDNYKQVEESFTSHFVSSQNNRRSDKLQYSWDLSNETLKRINNIRPDGDTINIAILSYTKQVYSDFELSVDIRMGTATNYWPVIGIMQQIPGKYYTTSGGGAGVFIQQNAKISMWGPIVNGNFIEQPISSSSSFYPAMWHNLRIVVNGSRVQVYVDEILEMTQLINATDYSAGYISLQSVNNDCEFDNFKIRAIGKKGNIGNEPNNSKWKNDGIPIEDYIK